MTESKEPQNVLITDSQHCKEVVSKLNGESVLAVHCLILERGYSGKLTLVLVGTYSGDVYLFDTQENVALFTEGDLRSLLESNNILKVGFFFHMILLHYYLNKLLPRFKDQIER